MLTLNGITVYFALALNYAEIPIDRPFHSEIMPLQLHHMGVFDHREKSKLIPSMVLVHPGCFQMGAPATENHSEADERPIRQVCIRYAYRMGQFEVTFAQFDRFAVATQRTLPRDNGWGRGSRPVIDVSWQDAVAYSRWLSQQSGKSFRLPSEAEWEYAARGGANTTYWWGNQIEKGRAVCISCGSPWDGKQTAPVGSFPANALGVHDTAGNVYEWVQDCWHDNYTGAKSNGSAWQTANSADCNRRVLRGGSWDSGPEFLRSANRADLWPGNRSVNIGFRLLQEID